MNLLIPIEYGMVFTEKIKNKFIRDIIVKLYLEDFRLINLWLRVDFGIDESITCEKIIKFALKNIDVIQMSTHYKLEFNNIKNYPGTSIRMITLLKTITYGTRYFRGNPLLLNEFKQLNNSLKGIYKVYERMGVVL